MTNATIVRLTVRNGLGTRRAAIMLALPLVLLALAVTVRILVGADDDATEGVVVGLGLAVILPLIALIAATSVLAAEIDDGSIVYLLAKPISRHVIVVSKYVVALGATVAFTVLPITLTAAIMSGEAPTTIGYGLGALLGAAAYCAIYLLLSTITRHAVAAGLLYLLLWEGLLGGLLDGIRWLSVLHWAQALASSIADDDTLSKSVGPAYAVIATALVVAGSLWLAGDRLRSFRLTGEE